MPKPIPFARPAMIVRSRGASHSEQLAGRRGNLTPEHGAPRRPPFPPSYAGSVRPSRDVVSTTSGDRTILLHLTQQRSYTLNPVAGRIWELVQGTIRVPEIVERISAEYDVMVDDARGDVVAFLVEFYDAALIECDDV